MVTVLSVILINQLYVKEYRLSLIRVAIRGLAFIIAMLLPRLTFFMTVFLIVCHLMDLRSSLVAHYLSGKMRCRLKENWINIVAIMITTATFLCSQFLGTDYEIASSESLILALIIALWV